MATRRKRKIEKKNKAEARKFFKVVMIGTLVLMVLAYLSYRG